MGRWLFLLGLVVSCKPRTAPPTDAKPVTSAQAVVVRAPARAPRGFVKGQLHAHTSQSADSKTPPGDVQRWYEQHGYDFVVFTDHNRITDTPDTTVLTMPGVELTRNLRLCEPPPLPNKHCLLHMNALFTSVTDGPVDVADLVGPSRRDVYRGEIARARKLGGLPMLNHPNMESTADEALLAELAKDDLALLEVGNMSWDSESAGDATQPSTERLWDRLLLRGLRIFATVTDDAHHYGDAAALAASGQRPFVGDLGFVVVRAEKNAAAIRAAVERGDFYGSSGVVFSKIEMGPSAIVLETSDGAPVKYEAIGKGGEVLHTVTSARFDFAIAPGHGPYVRVRATRADGAFALTQAVFEKP